MIATSLGTWRALDIPVTTWTDYAIRLLEVERKYYEKKVETLAHEFDCWLKAEIEEYNKFEDKKIKQEDLTQEDMIEYKGSYEWECKKYSVDFLEWLGYCSEEAYTGIIHCIGY